MEYRKQQFLTYDDFTRQFACDYAMPLARGGHGEIYRGVDLETNEEVAIKRRLYSVDDNALTLEKEYAHTQAVPVNRFVVRYLYYGRYVTPFGTYEFLVMRFYRDGNLTNTALSWASLSNLQQQRFISEFLLGLSHLHTHGIVHRDIKPENVLLVRYSDSEGIAFRPVIVDFGISKMMTDHPEAARAFVQNSMRIGTVTYMAPEQLRTENIDYNADLWSFGIILYELITGKHMIARKSFPETQREEAYTFWRMANEERFPADLRTVPQPYQQIIRKCLIVSPEERVQTARDLLNLLDLQPRIVEAEQAFRRQNWEGVIDALEPIVEKAEISELDAWLQQARMQQALSQPVGAAADEPQATRSNDDATETAPEADLGKDTNVPEGDEVIEIPVAAPAIKAVPYTAQTELLEEPVDVFRKQERPVETEFTSAIDQQLDRPAVHTETETASQYERPVADEQPVSAVEPELTAGPVTEPAIADKEEIPITAEKAADEREEHEPTTGELTEAFSEVPAAAPSVPVSNAAWHTPEDPFPANEALNGAALTADKPHPVAEPVFMANGPYTEAFTDVPDTMPTSAGSVGTPVQEQIARPADVPARRIPAHQAPVAKQPSSFLPRLKKSWDDLDTDQVKTRVGQAYDEAKKVKNRPLVIGGAVVLLLLILFSVDPSKTAGGAVQLDPNESYATSLKRFQEYSRTYEKTGELNPYVWAFVHCNPVYDDSLRKSAVRRAEIIRSQHELLFGSYSDDISKLKRLEMRTMSKNQMNWEIRPHSLSDENCLPRK